MSLSDDELMKFGEEALLKGNLLYQPPVEVLPKTERTAERRRKKLDLIRRRIQEQEDDRKRKEMEEQQRRLREQEAKKLKQQQELKKKEEERRKREEEEQRAKMEGGLDDLLGKLMNNTSAGHVTMCGMICKKPNFVIED